MYLRIGNEIINTDNIVTARVSPAAPASVDEYTGEEYRATLLRVEVVTTAVESRYDDGGDYRTPHTETLPYTLALVGDEAEKFLSALPVYEPVDEEKEETRTSDSPHLAYAEGRLEDARRLLLREYGRKDVRRLIQLDGHRVGGGDDVMRPDEDGHSLTAGDDVGLYNIAGTDHMPVRVLVCAEAEKTEVLRLLDKVRDWVECDYHGLRRMATESPAALAGLEAPADSGEVPDIPF